MDDLELTLSRMLPASPERVFEMWADAAHRINWWCPRGLRCAEFDHDFEPEGTWQARLTGTETGKNFWMGGRYLAIAEPTLIRFSFAWLEDGTKPGRESVITVTFEADGNTTRQTFHQSAFGTVEARDAHRQGWSECLDRLGEALS